MRQVVWDLGGDSQQKELRHKNTPYMWWTGKVNTVLEHRVVILHGEECFTGEKKEGTCQ